MLTDTEEEEEMKQIIKTRKHRSISKQHKLNRSPSSKNPELPKRKQRSPNKKRADSIKLAKDEIKYQRFVNGLKKDIHIYLNKCLRESRFDPRGNQNLQNNSTFKTKRTNEINKLTTNLNNKRQYSMKPLKSNETKRLTADVQAILTGPALKTFYTQFIQPREQKSIPTTGLRPLDESILWSNEQE